jgi:hypothetical protein
MKLLYKQKDVKLLLSHERMYHPRHLGTRDAGRNQHRSNFSHIPTHTDDTENVDKNRTAYRMGV